MSKQTPRFIEFDSFRIDLRERTLLHSGEPIALTSKVFETLLVLIQNRGQVLDKEILMKMLWPDSFVEESNLAQNISLLRKALHKGDSERQYIETIPKRGYRFTADINELEGGNEDMSSERHEKMEVITENRVDEENEGKHEISECVRAYQGVARRKRRWLMRLLAACIITLTSAFVWWWSLSTIGAEDDLLSKSIAIVPFRTVGVASEGDVLGLGMADTLIIKLSKIKRFRVLPTSSVYKYMAKEYDARTIGLELGADFVLDGTVQRSGERLRVSAQLTSVADGRTFWAGHFDEKFTDIFEIHDLISESLAQALMRDLTRRDSEELAKRYTKNPEAYEAYITGIYFWNKRNRAALSEAIVYFEKAVEKDPSFGLAFAMLSDSYFLSHNNGYDIVPPDRAKAKFIDNAKRALELDPTLPEAHMVMAAYKNAQGDFQAENNEYRTSLELNPSFAIVRVRYSYALYKSLQLNEAVEQMRMAQELDPVSPINNAALCYMLTLSRREDDAIKYCQRALKFDPEVIDGHLNLGETYLQKGLYDNAISEFEKARDDRPLLSLKYIAYAQAMAGRREEALKTLTNLKKLPDGSKIDYSLVLVFIALRDIDTALKYLDALPLTRLQLAMLKFDPRLDTLRTDNRFISFLQRKGLDYLLAD